MLLEKVIVENIRSHKHYELEPLLKGITAINGENGSGKSTILDSVAWSFFGSKVNGQKNKDLIREDVDPKEEPVRVTTYISIGDQKYKIKRQILDNNGIVHCKVYSKLSGNDSEWKFEAGPSVKDAEKEIRRILNSDEKGFLSSVFIQQKQVDQIISASPKERGQVIEKLIGVSAITESINLAKEEIRGLQKAANLIKVESLDEAKERLVNQGEKVTFIKELIGNLEKEVVSKRETYGAISKSYELEKVEQLKVDELTHKLEILNSKKDILNDTLENQLNILNNSHLKRGKKIPLDLIEKDYQEISLKIQQANENLYKDKRDKDELDKLFNYKVSHKNIKKDYQESIDKLENKKTELSDINNEIVILREKIKNTNNLIKLLKSGNVECSLCGTPFSNPEEELNKHLKEKDNYKETSVTLTNTKNLLIEEIEGLELENSKLLEELEIYNKQVENKDRFKELEKSIKSKEIEITNLSTELDIINKKLVATKAEKEKEEILSTTKIQVIDTKEKIKTLDKEIKNIQKDYDNSSAISKKEFKQLEKDLDNANKDLSNTELALNNKRYELELEKEKGRRIHLEYNNCKQANEDYKKLVDQLTVLKLSSQALQQFKKERIKNSIPALTKIASEIFSKFTEEKFTELVLNDKFEAFVKTEKQKLRSVSLLSGGELSAAAIALRLAISLFLSNEQENLLILDEVLVSMSEDRSQTILDTIAGLSKSQIIFIAHNISINQIADKVVQL